MRQQQAELALRFAKEEEKNILLDDGYKDRLAKKLYRYVQGNERKLELSSNKGLFNHETYTKGRKKRKFHELTTQEKISVVHSIVVGKEYH